MELIASYMSALAGYVWSLPLVCLLVGSGLILSLALGGVQFRAFGHAIAVLRGKYDDPNDPGQISHFQALTTALSATVGMGNIAGVAVAIKLGGPGAVFWMMITGLVGMATKFGECTLAIMYRRIDKEGEVHGGPMYYIERGLGKSFKPFAVFFAIACAASSLGAGNMFQSNQIASIVEGNFGVPTAFTGIGLAILTAIVIIGGITRIGKVTSFLVPFMAAIYFIGASIVIFMNIGAVPAIFAQIFTDAFTGTAAAGGFAGIAFRTVLVQGVRRACFSNEAGSGSAPIAHSAAATGEPVREGVISLLGPFIDTIVICTMTALVILISGAWTQEASGVELTAMAFNSAIPGFGYYFLPVAVFLFGYSCLISWSYYGERAVDYLFGKKGILPYKILFCTLTAIGAQWKFGVVLDFSDAMYGLMAIPNLIAILLLLPKIRAAAKDYFQRLQAGAFPVH